MKLAARIIGCASFLLGLAGLGVALTAILYGIWRDYPWPVGAMLTSLLLMALGIAIYGAFVANAKE